MAPTDNEKKYRIAIDPTRSTGVQEAAVRGDITIVWGLGI